MCSFCFLSSQWFLITLFKVFFSPSQLLNLVYPFTHKNLSRVRQTRLSEEIHHSPSGWPSSVRKKKERKTAPWRLLYFRQANEALNVSTILDGRLWPQLYISWHLMSEHLPIKKKNPSVICKQMCLCCL